MPGSAFVDKSWPMASEETRSQEASWLSDHVALLAVLQGHPVPLGVMALLGKWLCHIWDRKKSYFKSWSNHSRCAAFSGTAWKVEKEQSWGGYWKLMLLWQRQTTWRENRDLSLLHCDTSLDNCEMMTGGDQHTCSPNQEAEASPHFQGGREEWEHLHITASLGFKSRRSNRMVLEGWESLSLAG